MTRWLAHMHSAFFFFGGSRTSSPPRAPVWSQAGTKFFCTTCPYIQRVTTKVRMP